ncbi:hypothetical protein ACLF3G_29135 [Falsiroseomonas sp. HC035]|uniref:hypothetical protein n=1 Tax=Falsiroseomonas sp. HC035 TaxID=3390999 RepID=UPI003D315E48
MTMPRPAEQVIGHFMARDPDRMPGGSSSGSTAAVARVMSVASSTYTVGWFARDAAQLRRVGEAFFGPARPCTPRLLLAAACRAAPSSSPD